MMRRLVVIFGRDGADTTGIFVDGILEDVLSSLPPPRIPSTDSNSSTAQAWVVIPGEDVVQHTIEVPSTNEKKALEAVPFLLEDVVAGDVSELHFATGIASTGRRFAGVISRSLMQSYLDKLVAHGISAEIITPDYLVSGRQTESWITIDGPRAIVSLPDESGLTIDVSLLPHTIPALFRAAQAPNIQLAVDPATARSVAPLLSGFSFSQHPVPTSHQWLQAIHDRLCKRVALNMRQGVFGVERRWTINTKPLKRAAALALALVALLIAQMIASGVRNNADATRALSSADAIARTVLPSGARLVNARAQTKALAASLKAGSADSFLSLSESLAQALTTIPGAYAQSIQFDATRQALSVGVVVPNYNAMAELRAQLAGLGLAVDDGGARQSGEAVLGDLVMRQP